MISVYVVSHKPVDLTALELPQCYKRIRVGNYEHLDNTELRDDCGIDTIAQKNLSYCELTALYWMWKNDQGSDYIGLCHYRRFFTSFLISFSARGILDESRAEKLLRKYDVILPVKSYTWKSTAVGYLNSGFQNDLNTTAEAIEQLYPEYSEYWYSEVIDSPCTYLYNMFIMPRILLNEYCAWLFDILFYVETHTDIGAYDDVHRRIYGYLAERLLSVWVKKNNLHVKEVRVINLDAKPTFKSYLKQLVKNTRCSDLIKKVVFSVQRRHQQQD